MEDEHKTKQELMNEIQRMRQRLSDLENLQTGHGLSGKTLRGVELYYRDFFESANDAIYFIGRGDCIFDCNPRTVEMYGCTREQIIGKTPYDFSPPLQPDGKDSRNKALDVIKAAFDGNIRSFEWRHCTYDGLPFDTEVSLTKIGSGEDAVIQAIVRDVTQRKQAEEALRRANRTLFDIIEFLPDATVVIDKEKRVIAWNRAMEEMTRLKKEDIVGKGEQAYAIPFYGEPRPLLLELVGTTDDEIQSRYDFVTREGNKIIAETRAPALYEGQGAYLRGVASPLFDSEGNVIGAIEAIRDITERKEAERRLRESEIKYRTLVDNANVAILIMKHDTFVDCNKKAVAVFGCSRDEIIGEVVHRFYPADQSDEYSSVERISQGIDAVLAGGRQFFESKACRYDGTPFDAEVSLSRVKLEGECLIQVIIRDITYRKETERMLEMKSLNLEEVNTALRVLLQERARDKDELEEKIVRNVKELVLPYIETLKQRYLDNTQLAYLDIVETNLKNIISPFMQKMTTIYPNLTPAEIKVANLIRDGKTVKEIASIFGVSVSSINSHRQHIRNKLGLANKKTNLKTYLLSLT
jgi:PAS domain S-box-containing protein